MIYTNRCPECFNNNLVKFGKKFIKDSKGKGRIKVQQYQCKDCGRITIYPFSDCILTEERIV